jgi:hypothetical protein
MKINCDKKILIKKIKQTDDIIEKTILKRFLEIKNEEIKLKEIVYLKKKELESSLKLKEIHEEQEQEQEQENKKQLWDDFSDLKNDVKYKQHINKDDCNNKLNSRFDDEIDYVINKP